MKKLILSSLILVISSVLLFSKGIEGSWKASIETDNGTFEFTVEYEIDGDKISGEFFSEYGNLAFGPGEFKGKEFEYTFVIDYVTYTHKGKLIKQDEILIKSSNTRGEESEFTLTREL